MAENKTESPAAPPDLSSGPSGARRFVRGVLFLAVWAVFVVGAVALQNARLGQVQLNAPYVDKLYTPETRYAKVLAFGYDMPMADFLYIRAIQAFGAQFGLAKKDNATVTHFFDTIVELDPQFLQAYEFGSLVMSEGEHPALAMKLNEGGWYKNPMEYRLPFLNAYTANWTMHKPDLGKLWAMKAIRARNCPDWLVRWLAYFDRESGRYEAALEFQLRSYLTCLSEPGTDVQQYITLGQVDKIAEQWHLDVLNKAVGNYLKDHDQTLPDDLKALASAGYLKDFRAVDYPTTMGLLKGDRLDAMLAEKRKTASSAKYVDLLDAVMAICIHGQSGVPSAPPDVNGRPDSYVLRHDLKHDADVYAREIEMKDLVYTKSEVHNITLRYLNLTIRPALQAFLKQKGAYPQTVEEALPVGACPVEPVSGHWEYDQETGIVRSPTFPEM